MNTDIPKSFKVGISAIFILLIGIVYAAKQDEINRYFEDGLNDYTSSSQQKQEAKIAELRAVHRSPIEYNLSKTWEIPPDLQWVKIPTHSRPFTIQDPSEEPCFIVRYKMRNGLFWTKKGVTDAGGQFILTGYTYPPHNDIVEMQVRQTKSAAVHKKTLRLAGVLNQV